MNTPHSRWPAVTLLQALENFDASKSHRKVILNLTKHYEPQTVIQNSAAPLTAFMGTSVCYIIFVLTLDIQNLN